MLVISIWAAVLLRMRCRGSAGNPEQRRSAPVSNVIDMTFLRTAQLEAEAVQRDKRKRNQEIADGMKLMKKSKR